MGSLMITTPRACFQILTLPPNRNTVSTGQSTSIKDVRRTASCAAGNGLGTTIKCLLRTGNGAAGNGLGTTSKYL